MFLLTLEDVALAPTATLRARLEAALAPHLADARAKELDQVLNRLLDGAVHRRAIPAKLVDAVQLSEHRARVSALAYEAANRSTTMMEIYGSADDQLRAQTAEVSALAVARQHEKTALECRAKAKAAADPQSFVHVGSMFDQLIRCCLDEAGVRIANGEIAGIVAVEATAHFQFSGHVEDRGIGASYRMEVFVPTPVQAPQVWPKETGHDMAACRDCKPNFLCPAAWYPGD